MEILFVVIAILQAYVIGSISFAILFAKVFGKKDVREYGSGNAGTTNVMRVAGVLPGILTFICDVLKGFAAAYIGKIIFAYLQNSFGANYYHPIYGALLCGVFCMIGHVFPVFFEFKGGKAVAVAVGICYVANWRAITIALAVFALVVIISRIVSVASLIATATLFVFMLIIPPAGNLFVIGILSFTMCAIIYLKHIENIKRIIKGEEKPLFGKKGN